MKKVLIVEDEVRRYYSAWQQELPSDRVTLLFAASVEEAEEQFSANSDIDVIAIDACVPGDEPTTLPLVRQWRQTFTGPMVAISSMSEYREMLLYAGCDYESSKKDLPKKLLEILDL